MLLKKPQLFVYIQPGAAAIEGLQIQCSTALIPISRDFSQRLLSHLETISDNMQTLEQEGMKLFFHLLRANVKAAYGSASRPPLGSLTKTSFTLGPPPPPPTPHHHQAAGHLAGVHHIDDDKRHRGGNVGFIRHWWCNFLPACPNISSEAEAIRNVLAVMLA